MSDGQPGALVVEATSSPAATVTKRLVNGSSGRASDDHLMLSEEKKETTLAMDKSEDDVVVVDHLSVPATPPPAPRPMEDAGSAKEATPTVTPEGNKPVVEENPKTPPFSGQLPRLRPRTDSKDIIGVGGLTLDEEQSDDVSQLGDFSPTGMDAAPRTSKHYEEPSDDDSSNDESSYFANNLPSPKSGGHHFSSIASNGGGGSATQMTGSRDYGRESDASLSLSDDSDDGMHHARRPHRVDPNGFAMQPRAMPELYPHPITRMHSVSSLVSTSSQYSSDTDPVLEDELRGMVGAPVPGSRGTTPSGRKSPVLGQHPPSRLGPYIPSPFNPQPSPPTILSTRAPSMAFPHPQPHSMTAEELAKWAASGHMPPGPFSMQPGLYGSMETKESFASKDSILTYSEDSETNPSFSFSQMSTEGGSEMKHAAGSGFEGRGGNGRKHDGLGGSGPTGSAPPGGQKGVISQQSGGQSRSMVDTKDRGMKDGADDGETKQKGFKVYWQRWMMLAYMSALNLLSDWTCYSVAPIAVLTEEAFGNIDPEKLVVVFLGANAIATACEPIILSRLGLRRTVVFGALLLMIGSIIKSGGMPPIINAELRKGYGEWRVYVGFFLVGLSQPLYQCTPALLSASWFPERERTMATGVALNANQVGIGFAFIFGTLLVSSSDDIPNYFGLLSIISTVTFLGALIQFDDAPPTPPSDTARVMRGTFEVGLPSMSSIFATVRNIGGPPGPTQKATEGADREQQSKRSSKSSKSRSSRSSRKSGSGSSGPPSAARRKKPSRSTSAGSSEDENFHGLTPPPAPARWGRVAGGKETLSSNQHAFPLPSPMMPGPTGAADEEDDPSEQDGGNAPPPYGQQQVPPYHYMGQPPSYGMPFQPAGSFAPAGDASFPQQGYPPQVGMYQMEGGTAAQPGPGGVAPPSYGYGYGMPYGYSQYAQPVWDPRFQQYVFYPTPSPYQQPPPYMYSYQNPPPPSYIRKYESPNSVLPAAADIDEGAEPVLTITPHHLDINIRDDQIILSTRACLSRPGFIHSLVSFTVSGIVINTLSTFMDYLVRLNGAGREYTGIVGGTFQFAIMISSLIIGQFTDKTRAYYSVTIGMLVLGAFGLAECGVNLDSDRGTELRWSLIVVAILVGPLQPVSTELGVDVVYPLSENTVLVIQQLFSNLLSALFIPCFKAFKDYGARTVADEAGYQPEYTFSFYVLIVLHAAATVFFATFNGRYLRFEHEQEKKAAEEAKEAEEEAAAYYAAMERHGNGSNSDFDANSEHHPLLSSPNV